MIKARLFATAILAVSGIATAAHASDSTETITTQIDSADLDLTTIRDQKRLDTRIRTATTRLCYTPQRDLYARTVAQECRETALASAEQAKKTAVALAVRNSVRMADSVAMDPSV